MNPVVKNGIAFGRKAVVETAIPFRLGFSEFKYSE